MGAEAKIKITVLQVLVSSVCLSYVLYQLKTDGLLQGLQFMEEVAWLEMAVCLGFVVLLYLVRMLRLKLWVDDLQPGYAPGGGWLLLYFTSVAFGAVTPARLGELSRISLLHETGLATAMRGRVVLLDKLADSLYIPIAFLWTAEVVGNYFSVSSSLLTYLGLVLLVVFGGALWSFKNVSANSFMQGICLTGFAFIFFAASNIFLFHAVGLNVSAALVVAVTVTVGALASLPISLAGVGIREAGLLNALSFLGYPKDTVFAVIFLEFFVNMVLPLVLFAGIFFWQRLNRYIKSA